LRWDNELRAVAQFKRDASVDALEYLATSGDSVDYELVQYSANELEDLQDEVAGSLQELGHDEYAVAVDGHQKILVTVRGTGDSDTNELAATLRHSIMAALPERFAMASIELEVVDEAVSGATNVYGGTDPRHDNDRNCTIGFTVVSGSTNGVATDGHCGSALNNQRDWVTGVVWNMTYENGQIGQWGTSSGSPLPGRKWTTSISMSSRISATWRQSRIRSCGATPWFGSDAVLMRTP
jgi:hypothetical protein